MSILNCMCDFGQIRWAGCKCAQFLASPSKPAWWWQASNAWKWVNLWRLGSFGERRAQRRGVFGETNLQLAARWPLPWLGEARTHLFIPLTARRGSARLSTETAHVSEPLTTLQSESSDWLLINLLIWYLWEDSWDTIVSAGFHFLISMRLFAFIGRVSSRYTSDVSGNVNAREQTS